MVEVNENTKRAFMSDNVEKHIRIVFPNGEHETITNDKIQANTFKFTESLCSQETLKFGLCEANVLRVTAECGNIKGCVIKVYIDAIYENETHTIPFGVFTVTSCKRQAGTHLRSIEAYSESITENDTILTPFQDWKLQNSVAYDSGSFNYGYEKITAELSGRDYEWQSGLPRYSTGFDRSEHVRLYLYEDDPTDSSKYKLKYRLELLYYSYYDVDEQTGSFSNEDRLYKCISELNQTAYDKINELLTEYHCADVSESYYYTPSTRINKQTFKEKQIDVIKILSPQMRFYIEYGENFRNCVDFRYKLENDHVYFPYIPNLRRITPDKRDATFIIPYRIRVLENNTIVYSYNFENDDNLIKYADVSEILPTINIGVDAPIYDDDNNLRYTASTETLTKYNIYSLLGGWLELQGLFGKSNRIGSWDFFSINDYFALYPQDSIFPNGDLYPVIASRNFQPLSTVSYKNADYEEYDVHKYGYVRATYLASDEENYSITVECDPTNDNVYDMTENEILLSNVFTADEVKELITTYFYPNVKDITYNPAQLNIKGLPFLEAGDVIKVQADEGTFKTFLFRRTLSGEQSLNDSIEAKGDERNENSDVWIAVVNEIERE